MKWEWLEREEKRRRVGQERVKWEPESDERAGPVSAQSVKWEWLESDERAGPVSAQSVKWESDERAGPVSARSVKWE